MDQPPDWRCDPLARRREWFRYYSAKRIGHQWFQVHLLDGLPVETVLEIGPNLGLVSALLHNAGYRVTTLDFVASQYPHPEIPHLEADLTRVPAERLAGYDAVLCCETLEHLEWHEVDDVLRRLRSAGPRWFVMSVPYMGFQVDLRLYLNAVSWQRALSLKWPRFFRPYPGDPSGDPFGHKWEVGYRGRSLKDVEAKLAAAGWRIVRRASTSPCRSVFYLTEPA